MGGVADNVGTRQATTWPSAVASDVKFTFADLTAIRAETAKASHAVKAVVEASKTFEESRDFLQGVRALSLALDEMKTLRADVGRDSADWTAQKRAEYVQEFNQALQEVQTIMAGLRDTWPAKTNVLSELYGDASLEQPYQYAQAAMFYFNAIMTSNASGDVLGRLGRCYELMAINYPHIARDDQQRKAYRGAFLLPPNADVATNDDMQSWQAMADLCQKEKGISRLLESQDALIKKAISILADHTSAFKEKDIAARLEVQKEK